MQAHYTQQTIIFDRIDEVINKANAHQTPALAADIATRSKWSPANGLSDSDILKKCIELIAYSQQAQALRVKELLNKGVFDKVFLGYNIEAVANLHHEQLYNQYWNQIGVIRFPQKLEAIIGCAQALLKIKKENTSFMTYLGASKVPVELHSQFDIDLFWKEFDSVQQYLQQKQMPFFNNLTSLCHLLMTLGYACIKPDSAVMGAAVKLGIISPGGKSGKPTFNDAKRKEVIKTIQLYCLSRNFNIRVLDGYLLIYGGQTGAKELVNPRFYE
jgi:3-methyladenine DNA glycosylase Tag